MSVHPVTELRAGRSIDWLASEAGIEPVTVARIETGVTRSPFRKTLEPLASALGVDPDDLALKIAQHNHAQARAHAASTEASA